MDIAIIGVGKLGVKVCEALSEGDHAITLVDMNGDLLDRLSQQFDVMTVNEDGRDIDVLKELNIGNFDYVIAASGSDETNMIVGRFAKALGAKYVIARVRDPEYMTHYGFISSSMGIDYLVNPDYAITMEIYKYLVDKYSLEGGIFTSGRVSLVEFAADKKPQLIGKTMPEVKAIFPNMLVAAISRNGKIIIPHGQTIIEENDYVYLVGERQEINDIHRKVYERGKYTNLQKVMIIGGGKTGFYLASKLADFGISVKLIEKDKQRCYYLSTQLDDVMVLCGDATDGTFLDEENIDDMDAVVTATGFDEENLLLALLAKHKGIEDVISKISHDGYKDLIESMGVDMALNPLDIVTSRILMYIQGSKRVISSLLIQGQAEILEFIAANDMKIINKPLKELSLPDGVLITAIHRGDQVIIPRGDDRILEGDKVTLFCLLTDLAAVEGLFTKKLITRRS